MFFNAQQPTSQAALSQLYLGNNADPSAVDSNLFLNSSQGYGYVQNQARRMGIDDPEQYFQQKRMAQTMAATPTGAAMNAAQMTGQFDPRSLPGQLAARDNMFTAVIDQQRMDAGKVAALQNQNNLKNYMLPEPGVAPALSPVMQTAMQQDGFSDARAWLLNKRLGANRSMVAPFNTVPQTGISSEALYGEPTFQQSFSAHPEKANQIFQALTGDKLLGSKEEPGYHDRHVAARTSEQKFGVETLRNALARGEATVGEDGALKWRKLVPDPITGKLALGSDYVPGNPFQKNLEKYMPYAASGIDEFHKLKAEKDALSANSVSLQNGGLVREPDPRLFAGGGALDTAGSFLRGSMNEVGNIFQGKKNGTGVAQAYATPTGGAIRHAAPILRNNPRFQALARRDPAAARRLILAIQMGGDTSAMAPEFSGELFGP